MIKYLRYILFTFILLVLSCDESENPYMLTITKDGNGASYGITDPDYYQSSWSEFEVVTVSAAVDPNIEGATDGVHFDGWTGDVISPLNQISVMMDSDKQLTANFSINEYTITINDSEGGDIELSPDPVEFISNNQLVYNWNDQVTFSAVSDVGHKFESWGGDLSGEINEDVTLHIDSDLNISATFTDQCTITANATSGGSITPDYDTESFDCGTQIQLTATEDAGYNFNSWTGNIDENDIISGQSILVTLNTDKTITANFSAYYTLNINATEGGTVDVDPLLSEYNEGDFVTLTANPNSTYGYRFVEWIGDFGSEDANSEVIILEMDEDKDILATFSNIYNLSINLPDGGAIDISPEGPSYTYGTSITIEPIPDNYYGFDQWTGDLIGMSNFNIESSAPQTFFISSDMIISANFSTNFLTINQPEEGGYIESPDPNQPSYADGTHITLTAVSDDDYNFDGWSNGSSDNPYTFTLESDFTISANFSQFFTLETTSGTGGSIDITPNQEQYENGDLVILTAVPDNGYYFVQWSGDVPFGQENNDQITLTMDDDKNVAAQFSNTYNVTINESEGGSVSINPPQGPYVYGTTITLTPNPDPGYNFDGWSNGSSDNPYTFTLESDFTISANFSQFFTLETTSGTGGSIDITPNQEQYENGDLVILTAVPDNGYYFVQWSGDVPFGQENNDQITLTMDDDKNVAAQFSNTYNVTINESEGGSVSINPPQGPYVYGTTITLTPNPDPGYNFDGWSNGSSDNPYTFTLESDFTISAYFLEQFLINLTPPEEGVESCNLIPELETYNSGQEVQAFCELEENFNFIGWTGDLSGEENPTTFIVTSDMNISAEVEELYQLTLCASPINGTVTIEPNQAYYTADTEVTITATSNECFAFGAWTESSFGTNNSYTFYPDSSIEDICATFISVGNNRINFTLEGGGTVELNPAPDNSYNSYCVGQEVELTAVPDDANWRFSGWSGDETSTDNPLIVTIPPDLSDGLEDDYLELVVTFKELCDITINYDEDALDSFTFDPEIDNSLQETVSDNIYTYFCSTDDTETNVNITAVINDGYSFSSWSGDTESNNTSVELLDIESDININLNTEEMCSLTFGNISSGGYIEIDGVAIEADQEFEYICSEETPLTLTAIPDENWSFNSWEGYDDQDTIDENELTVLMVSDKIISCTFEEILETLLVKVSGNGNVSVIDEMGAIINNSDSFFDTNECHDFDCWNPTNSCSCYILQQGTHLYLEPSASGGSTIFISWTGDLPEDINPNIDNIDFILDSNEDPAHTELTANFIDYYTLDANLAGNMGSTDEPGCTLAITPSPIPGLGYSESTPINLEVDCTADTHWSFDQWESTDITIDEIDLESITFTIENDISITGQCQQQFSLSADVIPNDIGEFTSPNISGNYNAGENITITAQLIDPDLDDGYYFDSWSGDISDDDTINAESITILMNADKAITANFSNMYTLTTASIPLDVGSFTLSPSGETYEYGTSVFIQTVALGAYNFNVWMGYDDQDTIDENGLTVLMDSDKTILATFDPYWTIQIDVEDGGDGSGGSVTIDPESDQYITDDAVTLTAIPDAENGYYFINWTKNDDSVYSTNEEINITITEDVNLTANFSNLYQVTASCDPELGTVTMEMNDASALPDDNMYEYNTVLILTANEIDSENSGFYYWTYAVDNTAATSTTNPLSYSVKEDNQFIAEFKNLCDLSVNISAGQGMVNISVDEGNEESPIEDSTTNTFTQTYFCDSEVTLTAESEADYGFVAWHDGENSYSGGQSITFTLNENITYNAIFNQLFELTLEENDHGIITHNSNFPLESIYSGTAIVLEAEPNTGWEFSHWTGDLSGTDNPEEIIMEEDQIVGAIFNPLPYYLNLEVIGLGTISPSMLGIETEDPNSSIYEYGDVVTLTANNTEGYYFNGIWTVDGQQFSEGDTYEITMNQNHNVSIEFLEVHTLTINETFGGSIVVNTAPDVEEFSYYYDDSVVNISAIADEWYEFSGWTGDLSGTDNPEEILMAEDKTIGAEFVIMEFTINVIVEGAGFVTVTGASQIDDGSADNATLYQANAQSEVQLIATATSGNFLYWGINEEDDEYTNPYDIPSLEQNYTITVYFGE